MGEQGLAPLRGSQQEAAAAAVYDEWARWLVVDTGAPWNWKPDVLPPDAVLRRMPALMYDHDNRRTDDLSIIHDDVTREDYAGCLRDEWDCSTAFLTGSSSPVPSEEQP